MKLESKMDKFIKNDKYLKKIKKYREEGKSFMYIANQLGIPMNILRAIRIHFKLRFTSKIHKEIYSGGKYHKDFIKMWEDGRKLSFISKHFNIPYSTLYYLARNLCMEMGQRYRINELLEGGTKYRDFKRMWGGKSLEYMVANLGFCRHTLKKASKINSFPPKENFWIISSWGKEKQFLIFLEKEKLPERIGLLYKRFPIKIGYKTFQRTIERLNRQKKISVKKVYGGKSGSTTIIKEVIRI